MGVDLKLAAQAKLKVYVRTVKVRQFDVVHLYAEPFPDTWGMYYSAQEVGNLVQCEVRSVRDSLSREYRAVHPGEHFLRISYFGGATRRDRLPPLGYVRVIVQPWSGKPFEMEKVQLQFLEDNRNQIAAQANEFVRLAICGDSARVQARAKKLLDDARPALLAQWRKTNYKDAPSITLAYFNVADAVPVLKQRILKPINAQADPDKAIRALAFIERRKAIPFLVTLPIWDKGVATGEAVRALEDICTLPDFLKECQNYGSWKDWWEKRAPALYHVPKHKF